MCKINQEIVDVLASQLLIGDATLGYRRILDFYLSLSEEDKKSIDMSAVEDNLIFSLENGDIDLDVAYGYCTVNEELKTTIDQIAQNHYSTKILYQYLLRRGMEGEDFVDFSVRAIKGVMPEKEEDLAMLDDIRKMSYQKGLYDDIVSGIKTSGDVKTVVCGALCFEPMLIDEIFGGKGNMYFYLVENTFTDNQDIECFKERLMTMDDNELKNNVSSKAREVDQKIKEKNI